MAELKRDFYDTGELLAEYFAINGMKEREFII